MEKITSFTINHLKLLPGVYVSRVDYVAGNPVTTFDLRMTARTANLLLNTAEMHTIEHLAQHSSETIRNSVKKTSTSDLWACRTGFYLVTCRRIISLATSFH